MKKSVAITIIALLFIVAQQLEYKTVVRDYSKILLLEGGVNLSVSVHEELYQTHRAGVGINVRASMRISQKTELGPREYDYRFVET
jgi:hypothetical protein